MENQPDTPYENPAIIEASHGDRPLLDRLVARELASYALAEDPDNLGAQEQFRAMDDEVKVRQRELGLLADDPGEPQ